MNYYNFKNVNCH